jgi:hypothetical protein
MLDKTPPGRIGTIKKESSKELKWCVLCLESSIYSRGITGVGQDLLCVGKCRLPLIHITFPFR